MSHDYLSLARRLGFLQLQAIVLEGDSATAHQLVAHLVKIAHERDEWKANRRPWPPAVDLSHWRQIDSEQLLSAVANALRERSEHV